MIASVKARYSNGVLTPLEPLDLEDGKEVVVSIEDAPLSDQNTINFKLRPTLKGRSDSELLEELAKAARSLGRDTITMEQYLRHGTGHPSTFIRRFGSWPKALERAGLKPSRSKIGITNEELFQNLMEVWILAGEQPRYKDLPSLKSRFSAGTYEKRFGSWQKALSAFVDWANAEGDSGHRGV